MFTQHAAEAENADNAAEQKRQMNKRVRYGEIVQVLSNKWKHEENTIQVVHVSFTPKKLTYSTCTCRTCKCVLYKSMYLLHVNDLVHYNDICHLSLWYALELLAFLPKLENKIIRKTDTSKHRHIYTNKCVEGSNHTNRNLFFGLFSIILKFLY